MGKMGKILAPIVAVLAILAAVFSFLVSSGFKEYRERSSKMAQTIASSVSALDAATNTGTSSKATFKAAAPGVKESGTLSYADYKKGKDAYGKNLQAVEELAGKVASQRDEMAESIASMSIALGMGESNMSTDDLKDAASYTNRIALAKEYAAAFQKRDADFISYIKKYAAVIGAGRNVDAIEALPSVQEITEEEDVRFTVKSPNTAAALEKLLDSIKAVNMRKTAYEQSIKNVKVVLSAYKDWKSNPAQVTSGNYGEILKGLANDLNGVNGKLKELVTVKSELNQTRMELQQLEKDISDAMANIAKLTKDNEDMAVKLLKYGEGVDNRKVVQSIDDIDPATVGQVLLDNREWNYVIVNLGNKEVTAGAEVIISLDKKYIASGKVSRVEDEVSLVEISRRADRNIPAGAKVYMGNNIGGKDNSADADED